MLGGVLFDRTKLLLQRCFDGPNVEMSAEPDVIADSRLHHGLKGNGPWFVLSWLVDNIFCVQRNRLNEFLQRDIHLGLLFLCWLLSCFQLRQKNGGGWGRLGCIVVPEIVETLLLLWDNGRDLPPLWLGHDCLLSVGL